MRCQRGPVLLLEREGRRGTEQQFRQVPCRSKACSPCRRAWDEQIVSNCTIVVSQDAYFLPLSSTLEHSKVYSSLKRTLRRAGASWVEIPQRDGRRFYLSTKPIVGYAWGRTAEPEKALRAALSRHVSGQVNSSSDIRVGQRVSTGWSCRKVWHGSTLEQVAEIVQEQGFHILAWYEESFYMQHPDTGELLRVIEENSDGN